MPFDVSSAPTSRQQYAGNSPAAWSDFRAHSSTGYVTFPSALASALLMQSAGRPGHE